jgi:membrane fusion protein (multidrug efflux system)
MVKKIIYPVVAIVGIALLSGAAWWYQSKPKAPQEIAGGNGGAAAPSPAGGASAARVAGVEVARAELMSLRDDAQTVGSLRSRQSVMMRPEVAGRVQDLLFEDGARVRKGQVLVQLDDTLQRAEVRQALAQVSIAKANHKRNQELVAQNFVAQRVLEESSANLQVVEAQLALSCARLSRMAILAPFDGTVGIRNVNRGDYVKDGADLINLEDISSMYVDFRLPERYQGKLRLQQTVELALDAFPGRAFKASVEAIDPLIDANGRSVGVRAVLSNTAGEQLQGGKRATAASAPKASASKPPERASAKPVRAAGLSSPSAQIADASGCPVDTVARGPESARTGSGPAPLRPGMFARVTTLFSVNDAALVVPEEAIVPQGGRQFVIKVVDAAQLPAADAKPSSDTSLLSLRQEVKLGVRRQGKVEILEGLSEGQTVVVAGQQRLQRDGTPLRIVALARAAQPGASDAKAAQPAAAASSAASR